MYFLCLPAWAGTYIFLSDILGKNSIIYWEKKDDSP